MLPLAGTLSLDLYRLYSVGAVLGWLAGNVYVSRSQGTPERVFRRRLLLVYLLGPPSFLYLLRMLAPADVQATAPLVPVYASLVYGIFFLVPVTFRGSRPKRLDPPGRGGRGQPGR